MVTGNFHAIFEKETYLDFVSIVGKGNVRKAFEDYMLNVIASSKQDIDGINLQMLELEIDKIKSIISKKQAELQNKLTLKEQIIKQMEEKKQEELQKEKERIQKETTCINCHAVLTEKTAREIIKGVVACRSCSMDSDVVKKYIGGKK